MKDEKDKLAFIGFIGHIGHMPGIQEAIEHHAYILRQEEQVIAMVTKAKEYGVDIPEYTEVIQECRDKYRMTINSYQSVFNEKMLEIDRMILDYLGASDLVVDARPVQDFIEIMKKAEQPKVRKRKHYNLRRSDKRYMR